MTPEQHDEYQELIQEIQKSAKEAIKTGNWTLFDVQCKALRKSCKDDLFLEKRSLCIYLPTSVYGLPLLPPE